MAGLRRVAAAGTGGLVYVRPTGDEVRQSYADLLESALRIAAGLQSERIAPGAPVLLQLELSEDFIPAIWGCIAAGVVPVPVAVGPTFTQPNSALQKLLNAAKLFGNVPVLASGAALHGLRQLPASLGSLPGRVVSLDDLRAFAVAPAGSLHRHSATDVAVLLLTSGSTGRPKGVPLTHRNLLAMAAGSTEANHFSAREVTLNWMALDHAGAVSFLGTMATQLGCTQIHVPTGYILHDPLRWLDLISRHRATISWAPNFAFTLFLDRAMAVEQGHWDLSCMRFLVNAGESVVARTARRFITLLQRHGLPPDALRPAFGMSETCSGITWSHGLTLENTTDEQPFVDLGPCIPGAAMRIVDEQGKVLLEEQPGLLQLRGPSVFAGYYDNPAANAEAMCDGWFTTGDLAYVKDGCLYITGRQKDVIIVNGANFYCHEIESVAESVAGVNKTFTAAVAVRDAAAETDQLALFFCPETDDVAAIGTMARAIRAKLIQEAGVAAAYVLRMKPSELPKTEIGKIQRTQLRKAFEAGTYRDRIIPLTRSAPAHAKKTTQRCRSELSSAIAEIWQEVLGVEAVGSDETFFELGGHSLLIVQVQARLQELIGRTIPIVELFDCPTVRTMAEHFAKDFSPERGGGREQQEHGSAAATGQSGGGIGSRDIAIIGIGLRFPGASTPEEFWTVLAEGRETIRTFTAEDALAAGVDPELVRNPNHVRAAPMLDAPEAFDAEFFRYTAKEARLIDPQQRVFLEVCWEAFEDAGYDPLSYPGKVGLYAAAGMNTYLANNLLANPAFLQEENGGRMLTVDSMSGFNIMITNDKDYLPTRVSYKLNLRGPSVDVQTACSSTLVTLHQACNSLLLGDCEMALAGGVSIKLPQHAGHLYSAGMLNSPDGHCRAYDEKAEGTIFGNGAGVVLLKPLAAAQRDGDHIYAVVKATASNNDGAGKVGYTAPSAAGQEDVCAEALARAGVNAETVTFVEGHGTGTALGDPIEVNALSSAFRRQTSQTGYCALGSVKTNVGHLQIASGIAGLIKTTLALHHRTIPGTLHFEKANPRIDFPRTPFFVNRETMAWPSSKGPRRAGVNSLGIGGSNVHVILEEAPVAAPSSADNHPGVLPLSARHPEALRQLAGRYAAFLTGSPTASLDDIAFTAQVGRARLPLRAAFVGASREDLAAQLRAFAGQPVTARDSLDFEQVGIALVFAGERHASAARARELSQREPVFREALEACATIAAEHGLSRAQVLGTETGSVERGAVFAWEHALGELLASYGIEPAVLIGQGVGEYVAASRAGILSLDSAFRLIAAEARSLAEFRAVAESISLGRAEQKVLSAHTGLSVEAEMASAEYWIARKSAGTNPDDRNVAAPSKCGVVIEVALRESRDARRETAAGRNVPPSLDAAEFPQLLAALFSLGYPIDWARGRRSRPGRRVVLPTYPWQHQAYWIAGTDLGKPAPVRASLPADAMLGVRWQSPRVREVVYETLCTLDVFPWLAEHRVHNQIVAPGAFFLTQVARQGADLLQRSRGAKIEAGTAVSDIVFVRALVIDPAQPRMLQTVFTPDDSGEGAYRFEVVSFVADAVDNEIVHVTGRLGRSEVEPAGEVATLAPGRLGQPHAIADHYALMGGMGIVLGPGFRCIREIRVSPDETWLRLESPAAAGASREWHPGLVDSFLQAAVSACALDGRKTLVPFGVQRLAFHGAPDGTAMWARAQRTTPDANGETIRCDVSVHDSHGALLAEARGFELREMSGLATATPQSEPDLVELTWERLSLPTSRDTGAAVGAWLLLAPQNEAGAKLKRALAASGAVVTTVAPGEVTQAEMLLRSNAWRGIVYAWTLAAQNSAEIAWGDLLACVRAAASRPAVEPARWVMVTALDVVAQSPLAGFTLGMAHEFPEWRPVHVEIDPAAADYATLLPWLIGTTTESRLALRDGVVHGARLTSTLVAAKTIRLVADGSYLITGGAGALGLATAEWLVANGARRVVLGGRRPAGPDLAARLAAWKTDGVTVAYESADVADPADVSRLIAAAEALGPLRGVFHAAGSLSDGLLRQAEPEAFGSVFGAKIDGAWQLHRAVEGKALDHFVLFSSVASLLGSPAQANYAAGNAFLDGLALHRRRQGLPALSIQWGPWDEIGMTARLADRDRQRVLARGFLPMAPAAALRALERLLGGGPACVGVIAWDRPRFRDSLGAELPALYSRLFAQIASNGAAANGDANLGTRTGQDFGFLAVPERTEAIEYLIRETVAAILGFASPLQVEREQSLFDLGVDSLSAVDVKNRLEKTLGKTLRATIAFDYPSAAAMAAHLATTLFPATAVPAPAREPSAETDLGRLTTAELKSLLEDELAN